MLTVLKRPHVGRGEQIQTLGLVTLRTPITLEVRAHTPTAESSLEAQLV